MHLCISDIRLIFVLFCVTPRAVLIQFRYWLNVALTDVLCIPNQDRLTALYQRCKYKHSHTRFFACMYHSITCLMFETCVSGALVQQSDSFLSLPRDDDDLGAKLCCNTMGRGQKTHSPTVPVSQLSETRGATTE